MILEGTYLAAKWLRIGVGTPWAKDWALEFSDDATQENFLQSATAGKKLVVVGNPSDSQGSYVQHFKVAAWQWL